jgi:autotransporter-associated beta strand protein
MTKFMTGSLTYLGTTGRNLTLGSGTTTLTGNMTFNVNGGELTLGSSTTASGISLTKNGSGLLRFDGLESGVLTGTNTISSGTLRIVSNNNLGSGIIFDVGEQAALSLDGNLSWNGDYILRNNSQLIRQTNTVISANATYAANRTLTSADGLTNGKHTIQSGVTITATSDLFGSTPGTAVGDRIVMEDASSIRSTGTFSLNENKGVLLMGTATIGASAGQTLTINSDISGDEGIVEIGGTNADGVVAFNGANTYLGATTVSSGTLLVNGSLASQQVTVSAGAAFGGTGVIAGNIHFDEGALLSISNLEQSFTVDGEISFGGGFGIGSLTGLNWNAVQEGRYTLISTSQDFSGVVSNYGIDNTYWFGNGRGAYFETGSLAMVVIPEPSVAILTGLGALALLRRRRSDS